MVEADRAGYQLSEVARRLVSELDPRAVVEQTLRNARRLTRARYAALGVLNEDRSAINQLFTAGVDQSTRRRIGQLPRGRGVLGVLIRSPQPLRLDDLSAHPESCGFPAGHPPMRTFLGVPIIVRGRPWANLYLTEKEDGAAFTEADQDAVTVLARWTAVAVDNAHVHESEGRRVLELEQAVRALAASRDMIDAIGGDADVNRVLGLIAAHGRALVDARTLLIMLRDGDALVVAACAGDAGSALGQRLPVRGSSSGEVLRSGQSLRVADVGAELRVSPTSFGVRDPITALLVPMLHRGVATGILAAFNRGRGEAQFSEQDEQMLRTFAQGAANAVAIRRGAELERLRAMVAATDSERARWARELHDETLQALGALRVLLASSVGRGDSAAKDASMRQAVADIESEIANLREIISDLRPSLLDDLGLAAAVQELIERRRSDTLAIDYEFDLPAAADGGASLAPQLETTAYRIVQEALTNIVKHAHATAAHVSLRLEQNQLVVAVEDNGAGFATDVRHAGFGLAGIRERVTLVGGTLKLSSDEHGTHLCARLPVRAAGPTTADTENARILLQQADVAR